MTILYLENDAHISNFFFKLLQAHNLEFYYINRLQSCDDYLSLYERQKTIKLLLVNTLIDNKDMLSYSIYIKRKFNLNFPVIAYTNSNIIENSIRAKQSGIDHFFVLPALPHEIIASITEIIGNIDSVPDEDTLEKNFHVNTHTNKGISGVFKEYLDKYFSAHPHFQPSSGLYERIMNEIEPQIILSSLEYTNGNRIKAADILGINRNTLRKKMTQYKINTLDSL